MSIISSNTMGPILTKVVRVSTFKIVHDVPRPMNTNSLVTIDRPYRENTHTEPKKPHFCRFLASKAKGLHRIAKIG